MKISRILHAGYLFESAGVKILFDPVFENPFSRNCFAYPAVHFDRQAIRKLKVDAVFISHYHDDHCSFESLDLLDRSTPLYMYCVHAEMFSLLKDLGFKNINSLALNEAVQVGGFTITPWLALDAEVDAVFQIQCEGLNILNAVDSWLDPETVQKLKPLNWNLVLWPFQTMREIEVLAPQLAGPADQHSPPELMQQLAELNPRAVVPGSCQFIFEDWSWYREAYFPISYRQFEADVKEFLPFAKVVRMNPGESFELSNIGLTKTNRLSWIEPVGEQNVDYSYNAKVRPPGTAEIARHFPHVDPAPLLDYCRTTLPQKLRELGPPEEAYFQKPVLWELRLFDNDGKCTALFYELNGSSITVTENRGVPDWRTELSLFKLHEALFNGESLSSMYVRINEGLRPELFRDVDITQDPLLRALFTGVFGAYQKAQLKKLQNPQK